MSGSTDILETDRIVVDGIALDVSAVIDFDHLQILKRADCELAK